MFTIFEFLGGSGRWARARGVAERVGGRGRGCREHRGTGIRGIVGIGGMSMGGGETALDRCAPQPGVGGWVGEGGRAGCRCARAVADSRYCRFATVSGRVGARVWASGIGRVGGWGAVGWRVAGKSGCRDIGKRTPRSLCSRAKAGLGRRTHPTGDEGREGIIGAGRKRTKKRSESEKTRRNARRGSSPCRASP